MNDLEIVWPDIKDLPDVKPKPGDHLLYPGAIITVQPLRYWETVVTTQRFPRGTEPPDEDL